MQSTGSVLELGKNQAYADDIRFASERTGIDQRVLASVINAEAAKKGGVWQENSYNKASRAGGLTQFIPGTWNDEAMRSGTYLNQIAREWGYVDGKNRIIPTYADKLLDMRFESKMAIAAAAEYDSLMFNRYTSGVVGADVRNDVTKFAYYLYLGHHEGGRGAVDFVNGSLSRKNPEPWARTLMSQNVPRSQQASLIANANGDVYSAYRGWLDGYITNNIKPLNYLYQH